MSLLPDVEGLLAKARGVANLERHRSGYLPTQQDATILFDQAQTLDDLDRQLASEIARLTELRTRVHTQDSIRRSILSPARRLPPEIWSEIFLQALPDNWALMHAGMRPLGLAQVCYAWRTIALQTPRLWTNLSICTHSDPRAPVYNPAVIKEELERTGRAPLHLSLAMSSVEGDAIPQTHPWNPEIWSLVCAEASRWETVLIDNYALDAFSLHAGLEFPALRNVAWWTEGIDDPDAEYELPLSFFANAPTLDFLRIAYQVPPVRLLPPSSWSLAELHITSGDQGIEEDKPPIAPCIPFILACSATLRICNIWSEMAGSFPENQAPISFPALEELYLDCAAVHLCRLISAPKLRIVHLADFALDHREQPVDEFGAFVNLLRNSSNCPSLRQLALYNLNCTAQRMVRCLRQLPSIEKLSVENNMLFDFEDPPVSLHSIHALTRDGTRASDDLLPQLVDLELQYKYGGPPRTGREDDAVRHMVESRLRLRERDGEALACLGTFYCDSDDKSLRTLVERNTVGR